MFEIHVMVLTEENYLLLLLLLLLLQRRVITYITLSQEKLHLELRLKMTKTSRSVIILFCVLLLHEQITK